MIGVWISGPYDSTTTRSSEPTSISAPTPPNQLADSSASEPSNPSVERHEVNAPANASHTLEVASAVGLPVTMVLIEQEDGSIKQIASQNGLIDLPEGLTPRRIGSPAHQFRTLTPGEGSVVLEPDAAVVLRAPGIRSAVADIDCMPWNEGQKESVSAFTSNAFTSADEWVVAYDRAMVREVSGAPTFDVKISLHNARHILISREREIPGTVVGTIDSGLLAMSFSKKDVVVDFAGPTFGDGADALLWTTSGPDATLLSDERHAWGTLQVYGARVDARSSVEAASSTVVFAGIPLGLEVGVSVMQKGSGRYGRIFFTHDGSRHVVTLEEPARIRMRVVDAADLPITAATSLTIACSHPDGANANVDEAAWRSELRDITLADGNLELTIPTSVPRTPRASFPCPIKSTVKIDVPGFDPALATAVLVPGGIADLGLIRLGTPRPFATIVIPGFAESAVVDQVLIASAPGGYHVFRVVGAKRKPQDQIIAYLTDDTEPTGEALPPEAVDATGRLRVSAIAVAHSGPPAWHWLSLDADLNYRTVPVRAWRLQLERSSGNKQPVRYGVKWEGLRAVMGVDRVGGGEADSSVTIVAPEIGAEFWWEISAEEKTDARKGSQALLPSVSTITIE